MSKNATKTNGKTTEEIVKETMAAGGTVEDAQEEAYNRTQNIYIQLFFGDQKVKRINQEGKPSQPPY
jgi:hypothetical protein